MEWCVSELIWTGELNDAYAIGGHVGLYDTTLRDGEQTVGVVLDPDQKLEIARLLDDLGIDRLGIASPEAVAELVGHTVELVDVPVHFHGHNDFGVATSSAVAAVRAGASYVHGTINGMGERAGNANLGEVALTLRALYGVESNLKLDKIRAVSARVRELSGDELEPWKPVTGDALYLRERGAVAPQLHE